MTRKAICSVILLISTAVVVFLTISVQSGLARSQSVSLLICGVVIGATIGEIFSEIEKRITKATSIETRQKTKALVMIGLILVAMIWVTWLLFVKNR